MAAFAGVPSQAVIWTNAVPVAVPSKSIAKSLPETQPARLTISWTILVTVMLYQPAPTAPATTGVFAVVNALALMLLAPAAKVTASSTSFPYTSNDRSSFDVSTIWISKVAAPMIDAYGTATY